MEAKRRTLAKEMITPKVHNTGKGLLTTEKVVKAPVSHSKHVDRIKNTNYVAKASSIKSLEEVQKIAKKPEDDKRLGDVALESIRSESESGAEDEPQIDTKGHLQKIGNIMYSMRSQKHLLGSKN